MPKVSVVLPVYNGANYVLDAVRSIQAQTFTDWELIIVDDGSTDASLSLLEPVAQCDSRISIFQNTQNLGLARTMNRAVALASGEYIAIQEQDDISTPDRLADEVAVLDAQPEVGLVSGIAEWLDDDMQPFARFPGILSRGDQYPQARSAMFQYLYTEHCKIVNAGCMFRKSCLEAGKAAYNESAKRAIDWEFFLRLSRRYRIWGLHKTVISMRRGENHSHQTKNRELLFSESRRLLNEIYKEFSQGDPPRLTRNLWRKAMSNELVLESRNRSRWRGLMLLSRALLLSPTNPKAWKTVQWYAVKPYNRLVRAVSRT